MQNNSANPSLMSCKLFPKRLMRRHGYFAATLLVCTVMVACSSEPAPQESALDPANSPTPVSSSISPRPVDPACPANGLWAVCSVEKRLKQSGFVAQKNDSIGDRRAGISVEAVAYKLNKSRLELYLYDDAATLQREISKVDTIKIAPVFIRSGNLVALLFTDDATQAERLALALTAGAPQR